MGGRGSSSRMSSSTSSGASNSSSSSMRVAGGSVTGNFTQTRDGVWESETKAYSAAALAGPNREVVGRLSPRFTIVEGEYKGNTVYRLYEQHLGRREFLRRFKSLREAAKWANK